MKIMFLFPGNFDIDGRAQHFEKGEEIEAREADALPLIEGLCAVEVKPEVKKKGKGLDGDR